MSCTWAKWGFPMGLRERKFAYRGKVRRSPLEPLYYQPQLYSCKVTTEGEGLTRIGGARIKRTRQANWKSERVASETHHSLNEWIQAWNLFQRSLKRREYFSSRCQKNPRRLQKMMQIARMMMSQDFHTRPDFSAQVLLKCVFMAWVVGSNLHSSSSLSSLSPSTT